MKNSIKSLFNSNLNFFKKDIFFKKIIKNDLLILLYHDVSDNPFDFHKEHNLNVSIKKFKDQIRFLSKYYTFISPLDLLKGTFERPAALITFDDGIKSNFEIAIKILLKYKLPSLHFLNAGPLLGQFFYSGLVTYLFKEKFLNDNNYLTVSEDDVHKFLQNKEIMKKVQNYHGPFANENDLITFDNNEYVFYGNHLFNHYNAANISLDFFKLNYDKNKKYLSKFNNYIDFFSYPFGAKDTCYNYKTEDFLKRKLKPLKYFYADTLSFNKKKTQSYHRFILDNDTDENIFKSRVIFNKTKNIAKYVFR